MEYDIVIREVLESKFAIYVLLKVKELSASKGFCTKADVMNADEGNQRTKFMRINDLIDAKLLDYNDDKRKHHAINISLTNKGKNIADLLDIALRKND